MKNKFIKIFISSILLIPAILFEINANAAEAISLTGINNYNVYNGTGAVNLSWTGNSNQVYRLYQSADSGATWKYVFGAENITADLPTYSSGTLGSTNGEKSYTVAYTGLYTIIATGAQGGNYNNTFTGGKGGEVSGEFWLTAGEIITYAVGNQNGYSDKATGYGGYAGGNATGLIGKNGGGATYIKSDKQGLLLVAGGGGGATSLASGKAGGYNGNSYGITSTGITGVAGGGGGYAGGTSATVTYHNHGTLNCSYHEHEGDSTSGGLCYQTENSGSKSHTIVSKNLPDDTYECANCVGKEDHIGKIYDRVEYGYYCDDGSWHQTGWSDKFIHDAPCTPDGKYEVRSEGEQSGSKTCYNHKTYSRSCTLEEGYQCGRDETYVENSTSASGGSNYINATAVKTTLTNKAGTQSGNGTLQITSKSVGYITDNYMNNVVSRDTAIPNTPQLVSQEAQNASQVYVTWSEPDDNGTTYQFKVEAFNVGSTQKVADSNIIENTLTSGIAGYYVIVNNIKNTNVRNLYNNTTTRATLTYYTKGSNRRILINNINSTTVQWLHVAAVDKAGNISETFTAGPYIDAAEYNGDPVTVYWPVRIDSLSIIDSVNNVFKHPTQSNTYFVKADGETEFTLTTGSYLDGTPRLNYMIDYIQLDTIVNGATTNKRWKTPIPTALTDTTINYTNSNIQRDIDNSFIGNGATLTSTRYKKSRILDKLNLTQSFTIGESYSNRVIKITPHAGATKKVEGTENIYWSSTAPSTTDANYTLTIIPDAEKPQIIGMDSIVNDQLLNRDNGELALQLYARDEISGIRELKLEIKNSDNNIIYTAIQGPSGDWHQSNNLYEEIIQNIERLGGELTFIATATDNVGNQTIIEKSSLIEFKLSTFIQRVPYYTNTDFRRGETGILNIYTWGYADKVKITFPDSWIIASANSERKIENIIIDYTTLEYLKNEQIAFIVPLYGIEDGTFEIKVEVYKDDRKLTEKTAISIVSDQINVADPSDPSGRVQEVITDNLQIIIK